MKDHSKDSESRKYPKEKNPSGYGNTGGDTPDFIREKIVRKKTKKDVLRFLEKMLAGGAVFGLAAALIFMVCVSGFFSFQERKQAQKETETVSESTQVQPDHEMPQNEGELKDFILQIAGKKILEDTTFYESVQKAVESLQSSVVKVIMAKKDVDWFAQSYDSQYIQSGILIRRTSDQFYVLTGYSGIADSDSVQIELSDGTRIAAQAEGYDTVYNMAVVSIPRKELSLSQEKDLVVVKVGDTASLSPGVPVFVIGNPSGSDGSVGIGFVSLIDKQLQMEDSVVWGIQNSVQINGRGCSFLMGIKGEILGLLTDVRQNISTGYSEAYGINQVMVYVNRILDGEKTAGTGIVGQDIETEIQKKNGIPEGVYITEVKKNSASYKAGVQAGDVLAGLDGQPVASMEEYEGLLKNIVPGKEVTMVVYRNSKGEYKKMELKVTPTVRQD